MRSKDCSAATNLAFRVMSSKSGKKETLSKQSAAQFFSEHQQIAGFDNPGKSLFTTIREFVENSLDAAESMHVLPEIELFIEEFSEAEHNSLHGIRTNQSSSSLNDKDDDEVEDKPKSAKAAKDSAKEGKDQMYYLIRCVDNGCGIPEENIGDMLGRVLSGSKHGIRQTRGKFGLGAKMALIWSKKSSGLPINIRTAHSASAAAAPSSVTNITLDIDIYRNEPRIIKKQITPNPEGWRGTEIGVTIAGHWGNYRSRVLQYFQQLAVITPYAKLAVDFTCHRDGKKSFRADFDRRSEQMPPIAQEIDPHPKSLNNITLTNLLQGQGQAHSGTSGSGAGSIEKFLTSELSGITPAVAARITASLGISQKPARSLQAAHVAALIQALRDEKQIKPPSAACLSPAGEYNMRLGVLKELKPKMVATFSDKAGAHEGHPFLVEAAVSLGGTQVREGINVYRFANRIPLLFEAGADVVTQVATKRINWSSYHIDPKKDNIGVYVSIVSTKIPFKGTSKEYVGEDVTEIFQSVKRALQGCCQQLRVNLAKSLALKEEAERRKTLVKYIPNIAKALFTVVQKMEQKSAAASASSSGSSSSSSGGSGARAGAAPGADVLRVLLQVSKKSLTETTLAECLQKAVDKFESDSLMQSALDKAVGDSAGAAGKRRRLFLRPDSLLQENPLPAELSGQDKAAGMSRQGSTQSVASAVSFSTTEVVDLTEGGVRSAVSSPAKSAIRSAQSPQRTGTKRSFLSSFGAGAAGKNPQGPTWVALILPATTGASSSTAAAAGKDDVELLGLSQEETKAAQGGKAAASCAPVQVYMLVDVAA